MTTQSIEQSAQSVWLAFWRLSVSLASTPEAQRPVKVAAVAVDPIYSQVLNSVRGQLAAGLLPFGYIVSRPTWPTPPTTSTRRAVMADCFDGSHAGAKVATTGTTKTVGEPRTNVRVTFVKGHDSKWRIEQIQYLKASC